MVCEGGQIGMIEEKRGQGGFYMIEMKDGENLEFVIRPRLQKF